VRFLAEQAKLHPDLEGTWFHRATAITDARDAPAMRLLERVGMRREGHFLQNVWFKGSWGDEHLYALLEQEWLELRSSSGP
jgi:RimJ/RimL family protein N-acetyltransferase